MSNSLLDLVLSSGLSFPGRRSASCICSKVAFLCGVVSSTTGLTGWNDRSRSSVFSNICIVRVGVVGNSSVRVRVCLSTTIVIVGIVCTVPVISDLVFFSFELKPLISIVTWFFALVASWFGLFRVLS